MSSCMEFGGVRVRVDCCALVWHITVRGKYDNVRSKRFQNTKVWQSPLLPVVSLICFPFSKDCVDMQAPIRQKHENFHSRRWKPVNRAEVDKVWSTEIFLGVVGGLRQGFVIVFSSKWVGLICWNQAKLIIHNNLSAISKTLRKFYKIYWEYCVP